MRKHEFLHNHPGWEKKLEIDKGHVIVDRQDWELARLNQKAERIEKLQKEFDTGAKVLGNLEHEPIVVTNIQFLDENHVVIWQAPCQFPFQDQKQATMFMNMILKIMSEYVEKTVKVEYLIKFLR